MCPHTTAAIHVCPHTTATYMCVLIPLLCVINRCGDAHTVALADNGLVYSWGSGIDFALGHGSNDDVLTPKLVAMLEADPCVCVAAGGCHSAAVSVLLFCFWWPRRLPFCCCIGTPLLYRYSFYSAALAHKSTNTDGKGGADARALVYLGKGVCWAAGARAPTG